MMMIIVEMIIMIFIIVILIIMILIIVILIIMIREGFKKKNWEKAVRLTAWVDPPPP